MNWSKQQLKDALAPTSEKDVLENNDLEEPESVSSASSSTQEQSSNWVNIATVEELLNPLLLAMHSLGGSANNQEIDEQVIIQENITEEQLAVLTKPRSGKLGRSVFISRLGWARTYLKDYGVLENPAPRLWALAENSKQTFHVNPDEVKQAYEKQRLIRKAQREEKKASATEEVISTANFLAELETTLRQRRIRRPEGSYSAQLFAAGPARIAQKVGEEALEVIIAALHETRERQISEVADLLIHTLILLVELNIPLEEVLAELQRRHEVRTS